MKGNFFKSTSFKCLITLLCILLVSGIFLTVMNSLLMVTDQERFDRAINKIYGKSVKTEVSPVAQYYDDAEILEAYKVTSDGNYLIKATGKGGYDNGTVTCWVVVNVSNRKVAGVGKVAIDSNKSQSYISNINSKFLNSFSKAEYTGQLFDAYDSSTFVRTGATFSATAICNAVNGALKYVNGVFGNVDEDPFENFDKLDYIDKNKTSVPVIDEDGNVFFHIATKAYGESGGFEIDITVDSTTGKIITYKVVKNGATGGFDNNVGTPVTSGTYFVGKGAEDFDSFSAADITALKGKDVSTDVHTGATKSVFLCFHAAAFATANYDKVVVEGGEENE